MRKELLQHPCLYLSAHLEQNRSANYDALSRVRESNDLNHWIRLYLVAIIETSKKANEIVLPRKTVDPDSLLGKSLKDL